MLDNGEDKSFETIRVTAELKARLLDDQEALRKSRGRKVSMTRLLTEMRDVWITASGPQAEKLLQGGRDKSRLNEGTKVPTKNPTLNTGTFVALNRELEDTSITVILDELHEIAQSIARLESRIAEIMKTSGSGSTEHVHNNKGNDGARTLVAEPLVDPALPDRPELPTPVRGKRKDPTQAGSGDHPRSPRGRH